MNAITIWQPWASLIALGHKTIETRSWAPPPDAIGKDIAIHAGKKNVGYDFFDYGHRKMLDRVLPMTFWERAPAGAVLAVATLARVEEVPRNLKIANRIEAAFGDYTPGRLMWFLEDVRPISPPLPAKGAQRIWQFDESNLRGHVIGVRAR